MADINYVQLPAINVGNPTGTLPIANGGTGQTSFAATAITTTFVCTSTDLFQYYTFTSGASYTITLPALSAMPAGVMVWFIEISGTAQVNNITIAPNGTDKIYGVNASFLYTTNFGTLTLKGVGTTDWWGI